MKVAVVGSGISGLVSAHLLSRRNDVVLFEAGARVGGHTHTVDVPEEGRTVPVDTGFIVFNERTYPNFLALLRQLGVSWKESDMSFSVRSDRRDFEYGAPALGALFAQKRNLVDPRFHRMLYDVFRFYREAKDLLDEGSEVPLLDWLEARGYSRGFVDDHLLPLVGSVWSSSCQGVREFPARFLARFFENHGFLEAKRSFPWLTIQGGSREYVRAILGGFGGEVRTASPVERITRSDGVQVKAAGQAAERFDHVVLAVHADQALRMLADPSPRRDRAARPVPLPRQRGPPPHRRAGHAAAQAGLGLLELPPGRRRAGRRHGHLLDEPAAVARHAARLLRDPEPGGRGGRRPHAARHHLRPPGLLPHRAWRPRGATGSSSATGAPATAGPTGAMASTRTAW